MRINPYLAYLDSFINYERYLGQLSVDDLRLERVQLLFKRLSIKIDRDRVIHVAGSKGKGSTCNFIANILKESGYSVGLYTSPHLQSLNERIRVLSLAPKIINRQCLFKDAITDKELAAIIDECKPDLESLRKTLGLGAPTYFEVVTALALKYFLRRKVDFFVLETGLGGRLDATNALPSSIAAITSLSHEHTNILGKTLAKIAAEKAGIIKDKKQSVILAPQDRRAMQVILNRCRKFQIKPVIVGKDIVFGPAGQGLNGQRCDIHSSLGNHLRLNIGLMGRHQWENAAVAVGVSELLRRRGVSIDESSIRKGLAQVDWPGRMEIIKENPTTIIDCAHNGESALKIVNTIKERWPGRKVNLLLGMSDDKDKKGICAAFNKIAANVVFTKAHHCRAGDCSTIELHRLFPGKACQKTRNVKDALKLISRKDKKNIVLISGSTFLVGEARELCIN